MKIGPVTKRQEKHGNVKKIGNDVMSAKFGAIVIFLIDGQFGAIWKLDCRCMVCKTYIFINSNLLSYKN